MFKKTYRLRLIAIFLTLSIVPLIFMGFLTMKFRFMENQYNHFLGMTIISITVNMIAVMWIFKKIAKPMSELRDAARDVALGKFQNKNEMKYKGELGEVMGSFNEMAVTIQHNYEDLQRQAQQLIENNEQLQEMNIELEASYEQLTATTDQLNESEQKYRILIENISDVVWSMDMDGKVVFVNDVIEKVLGYKKEEVIGKELKSIMCPLHKYECDIIDQLKQGDFEKKDIWMLTADGKRRVILETSTRRFYYHGRLVGIQGLGRDVTEYVKIKNEIIRRNNELTLFNEISNSLTSTISTVRTDTLLQKITDKIVEIMGVSICTIRLLDENNMLEFKTTSGSLNHLVLKESIPLIMGDIGEAVIRKKTVILDNFDDKQNVAYYVKQIQDVHKVRHVIYIPLMIEEQVIGVMGIASSEKMEQENVDILKGLSNNAAVAIEKSRLYEDLKQSFLKTIKALAMAVEVKDSYTLGHSTRVSQYAVLIGRHLGLESQCLEELETAGILHDIGKIGISDGILTKPGRLNASEYEIIKQHSYIGSKILEPIGLKDEIMQAILLHHKRYDLQGYPEDSIIEELPLYARIIGVADAFDAMISNRSYKTSIPMEEAKRELKHFSGSQFDPEIVVAMEQIIGLHTEELEKIALE